MPQTPVPLFSRRSCHPSLGLLPSLTDPDVCAAALVIAPDQATGRRGSQTCCESGPPDPPDRTGAHRLK